MSHRAAGRLVLTCLLALLACGALAATVSDVHVDDPRQQIDQRSNGFGQLKGYPATDNIDDIDDPVYDDVSFSQESDAESDELSHNPEFPPALQFNSEKNRIHKRLPTLSEDYQLPQNKMVEIAEGA